MRLPPEKIFATFSLLFFTGVISFNSLFTGSEGSQGFSESSNNPLSPLLSLIQHGICLLAVFLLFERRKSSVYALSKNKSIFLFISLLISLFVLSSFWSAYPDETSRRSFALLETSIFAVYLALRFTLKEQLNLLVWVLGISMVISVLFTLSLPSAGIESGIHSGAWRGPLEHKNYFGRLMTLSALVFVIAEPESRQHSRLLKLGFCFSLLLVILSTGKTALAVTIYLWLILLPMYKSMQWNFKAAKFKSTTILQAITTLIGGCVLVVAINNLDAIAAASGRDLTLTGRTVIWSGVIEKLQEQPWLGYGYYGFWYGLDGPSADVIQSLGGTYIVPHSHNGFFELAIATGLLGVITFFIGFLLTTRKSLIKIFFGKGHNSDLWTALYLSFLVVYNLTEYTLVTHNSIFWVLYVSLALSNFSDRSKTSLQK